MHKLLKLIEADNTAASELIEEQLRYRFLSCL